MSKVQHNLHFLQNIFWVNKAMFKLNVSSAKWHDDSPHTGKKRNQFIRCLCLRWNFLVTYPMALFFFERCVGVMVTQFSLSMPLCEIIMVTAFGNNMVLHPFLTCM